MRGIFADRAAVVLTGALFVGLEALTFISRSWYWPLFGVLVLGLLAGVWVALREDLRSRGPHVAILPVAYILSVLLFHLFVSSGVFQQLFILAGALGFLLLVARATEWAYPSWTWLFTSGTFFLSAAGMYGLTFHLRFPLWLTALGIGTMTGFLTYHVASRAVGALATRLFWSATLALLLVEFLVVLALFPLSYPAVGGVLFVLFYLLLHLLQRHLYERLKPRQVAEYVGVALLAVGLILVTAEWRV